jgi:hypothetical protein
MAAFEARRVAELVPGDETPWYRVVAAPEAAPDGRVQVLVKHFDNGVTDYVTGSADDEVPVKRGGSNG